MKRKLIFHIDLSCNKKTVKSFLLKEALLSNTTLKQLKKSDDGILLNGNRVFVTNQLNCGDLLEINIPDTKVSAIEPVKGDLDILYEDEDILAIDKPPFIPVHPSKGHIDDSLANIVIAYLAEKTGTPVFRCVTRLDKNTSGVVLIAKNSLSHNNIRKQLLSHDVTKIYHAVVHGITDVSGMIDAPIVRPNAATIKREIREDGAPSVTNYKTIKTENDVSYLEVIPVTGRTHQIRVHMAYIDHPICGDFLYGDPNDNYCRQMLHAYQISFKHPTKNEAITIQSNHDIF